MSLLEHPFVPTAWASAFENLLSVFSSGPFENDLHEAKEVFFAKLGRSHEMKESTYEAVSQSFLEWYLYDYSLPRMQTTPVVVYLTRGWGGSEERAVLKTSLLQHWSLYRVGNIGENQVELEDLLVLKKRTLRCDPSNLAWQFRKGQVVQLRLFPYADSDAYFATHFWVHPVAEADQLEKICQSQQVLSQRPMSFLTQCFECLIRSLSLEPQMRAAQAPNWMYLELMKRYAQTN